MSLGGSFANLTAVTEPQERVCWLQFVLFLESYLFVRPIAAFEVMRSLLLERALSENVSECCSEFVGAMEGNCFEVPLTQTLCITP